MTIDEILKRSPECIEVTDIECRTFADKVDVSVAKQVVTCDTEHGFICRAADQRYVCNQTITNMCCCNSYEVRIRCVTRGRIYRITPAQPVDDLVPLRKRVYGQVLPAEQPKFAVHAPQTCICADMTVKIECCNKYYTENVHPPKIVIRYTPPDHQVIQRYHPTTVRTYIKMPQVKYYTGEVNIQTQKYHFPPKGCICADMTVKVECCIYQQHVYPTVVNRIREKPEIQQHFEEVPLPQTKIWEIRLQRPKEGVWKWFPSTVQDVYIPQPRDKVHIARPNVPPLRVQYPARSSYEFGPWIEVNAEVLTIQNIRNQSGGCQPKTLECQTLITQQDYLTVGQTVVCDIHRGFICRDSDQRNVCNSTINDKCSCYKYKVRVGCAGRWYSDHVAPQPTVVWRRTPPVRRLWENVPYPTYDLKWYPVATAIFEDDRGAHTWVERYTQPDREEECRFPPPKMRTVTSCYRVTRAREICSSEWLQYWRTLIRNCTLERFQRRGYVIESQMNRKTIQRLQTALAVCIRIIGDTNCRDDKFSLMKWIFEREIIVVGRLGEHGKDHFHASASDELKKCVVLTDEKKMDACYPGFRTLLCDMLLQGKVNLTLEIDKYHDPSCLMEQMKHCQPSDLRTLEELIYSVFGTCIKMCPSYEGEGGCVDDTLSLL